MKKLPFAILLILVLLLNKGPLSFSQLIANNNSFIVFSDGDNDGLDDGLEARWGTYDNSSDSDGDMLSDLDEVLIGTDPTVFNTPSEVPTPTPKLKIDSYIAGSDWVLEVMSLEATNTSFYRLYWADEYSFQEIPRAVLARSHYTIRTYPSAFSGFNTKVIRLSVPLVVIESLNNFAVAAEAFVDGIPCGDYISYFMSSEGLLEWRERGVFARYSSGSGANGGGLFPVNPNGTLPGEVLQGEVCVQTLQEVAGLGGGQKLYQVSDSYCDYLPTAKCFVGCEASIGDTVVGIDIVTLLAN